MLFIILGILFFGLSRHCTTNETDEYEREFEKLFKQIVFPFLGIIFCLMGIMLEGGVK